jgi:peptidoglycan-associated lipoprotein
MKESKMVRSANMRKLSYMAGLLVTCVASAGCPKRSEVVQAAPTPPGPVPRATAPKAPEVQVARLPLPATALPKPVPATQPAVSPLQDIFFNFDDVTIHRDRQAALAQDFKYLEAHPGTKLTVAGHCDERGTEEYNLALGQRRAETVKQALVAEGIAADRIATISYGEDRPFAQGHDERAWHLNRRDHLTLAP